MGGVHEYSSESSRGRGRGVSGGVAVTIWHFQAGHRWLLMSSQARSAAGDPLSPNTTVAVGVIADLSMLESCAVRSAVAGPTWTQGAVSSCDPHFQGCLNAVRAEGPRVPAECNASIQVRLVDPHRRPEARVIPPLRGRVLQARSKDRFQPVGLTPKRTRNAAPLQTALIPRNELSTAKRRRTGAKSWPSVGSGNSGCGLLGCDGGALWAETI